MLNNLISREGNNNLEPVNFINHLGNCNFEPFSFYHVMLYMMNITSRDRHF